MISLDGFPAKHLAESWHAAPPGARESALAAFKAEDSINFALLSPLNLVFDGVHLRALRTGVIQAYIGEPSAITTALGVAAPTTITLWLLVMGILLAGSANGRWRRRGCYSQT